MYVRDVGCIGAGENRLTYECADCGASSPDHCEAELRREAVNS
jgi:hypothetical protein